MNYISPFNPFGVDENNILLWYDCPQIVLETVYGQLYIGMIVEDNPWTYWYFPTIDVWVQELKDKKITLREICLRGIDKVIEVKFVKEDIMRHVPRDEITDNDLPSEDSFF